MAFENIKNNNEVTGEFLEEKGGANLVASSVFELHPTLGERYKWQAINEMDLLKLLNEAGITKEDINTLVETDIRPMDDKGVKNSIDFDKSPELLAIRNKLAKVSGKELIEA